MEQITKTELIELLKEINKSTFIHLVTETEVGMKKTNNPYYKKVIKRSSSNYLIGNQYGDRVWGNYEKEGLTRENFEVGELSGKRHISKCVLENTNKDNGDIFYLMVERFDEIKPKVEYFFEGNPIDKTLFEGYMNKVYDNKKQECERKVNVITPKIDSIKQISIDKNKYEIVG